MDCRKTLGLSFCLLLGAAGCSHNVIMRSPEPPVQASSAPAPTSTPVQVLPPGAVVRKAADLPPRMPHASTCVAFGDWASSEANAADLSDTVRQAKREKARKAFQQALAIDPHYLPAYESLALLYDDLKDHSHAVATYRKAAEMFPNEPRIFYDLGKCYGGAQEWTPAILALGRAVDLDPENRQYVDTLGWMQARVGRYDDSLTTFRKVHDVAEAHYRLALMLDHLNQPELCKQQLLAALEKDPHQERARTLLAKVEETPAAPSSPPYSRNQPSRSLRTYRSATEAPCRAPRPNPPPSRASGRLGARPSHYSAAAAAESRSKMGPASVSLRANNPYVWSSVCLYEDGGAGLLNPLCLLPLPSPFPFLSHFSRRTPTPTPPAAGGGGGGRGKSVKPSRSYNLLFLGRGVCRHSCGNRWVDRFVAPDFILVEESP